MLVDSSVWIGFFNGAEVAEVNFLSDCLGQRLVAIGDLMLAEVLQGFRNDKDFQTAVALFDSVAVLEIVGKDIAVKSAKTSGRCEPKASPCEKRLTASLQPTASNTSCLCYRPTETSSLFMNIWGCSGRCCVPDATLARIAQTIVATPSP